MADSNYYRDVTGWKGMSLIAFTHDGVQMGMRVYTHKEATGEGLATDLVCYVVDEHGFPNRHSTSAEDFRKTIAVSHPARVSEKTVRAQHEAALEKLDALQQEIDAYYTALKSNDAPR